MDKLSNDFYSAINDEKKNLIKINEFMHLNSLPILLLMIVFSLINFITMSHNLSYGYTSAFAHFIFILPVYGYCAKKSMVFFRWNNKF